jgi:hypothetical protein
MTGPDSKKRDALMRLADALVEDLLAMPDQEVLAEFAELEEPGKNADRMRALFEESVLKVNKQRLKKAQAGVATERGNSRSGNVVIISDVRDRFRRALAACPPDVRLTLAARNENELSDADMLGMLQDLEELGIAIPEDRGDK